MAKQRAKKSPVQLDREIEDSLYGKGGLLYDLRPRPINPRKRVRYFSRTTDKTGRVRHHVTYDDPQKSGYEVTLEELQRYRQSKQGRSAHATKAQGERSLVESIQPGDRVTIVDRFGKQHTGRAVMRGTYGWVLNMGGAHGKPGIATDDNTVKVRCGK